MQYHSQDQDNPPSSGEIAFWIVTGLILLILASILVIHIVRTSISFG